MNAQRVPPTIRNAVHILARWLTTLSNQLYVEAVYPPCPLCTHAYELHRRDDRQSSGWPWDRCTLAGCGCWRYPFSRVNEKGAA